MNNAENNHTARSLAAIVAEIKQELKDFVEIRIAMLKSELRDKVAHWRLALPLGAAGAIFLGTAYFLIVASMVALAAVFIGNTPYRWFFALLGVAVLWSLIGGVAVYIAVREFAAKRLMPEKTIEVLKADKLWLQTEARNQI